MGLNERDENENQNERDENAMQIQIVDQRQEALLEEALLEYANSPIDVIDVKQESQELVRATVTEEGDAEMENAEDDLVEKEHNLAADEDDNMIDEQVN